MSWFSAPLASSEESRTMINKKNQHSTSFTTYNGLVFTSVGDPEPDPIRRICIFLGFPDPDPLARGTDEYIYQRYGSGSRSGSGVK